MKPIHRMSLLAALLVGGALRAQEPWDMSFKLLAAQASGLKDVQAGKDQIIGLAMEGAYPILFKDGVIAFEAGWRKSSTQTSTIPVEPPVSGQLSQASSQHWASGLYGSAVYRHKLGTGLFYEGLYVHAGLRYSSLKTRAYTGSKATRTDYIGRAATSVGPVVGAGFRFTDKLSLEVNLSPMKTSGVPQLQIDPNDPGNRVFAISAKTSQVLEVALGIHL